MLEWLATREGVFCAQDVLDACTSIDKVSVYRTLDLFAQLDIIHPVALERPQQHYEVHGKDHHHHVVCESCDHTACVQCPAKQAKAVGFSQIHHSFTMTGLCQSCQ